MTNSYFFQKTGRALTQEDIKKILDRSGQKYKYSSTDFHIEVEDGSALATSKLNVSTTPMQTAANQLKIPVQVSSAQAFVIDNAGYTINLTMSEDTVKSLRDNKFNLFGFKAVSTSSDAYPLIWFQYPPDSLHADMTIQWEEDYDAYVSSSKLIPGGFIDSSDHVKIKLDEIATVSDGVITAKPGGTDNLVTINNDDNVDYRCGISQEVLGSLTPICALDLAGNTTDEIEPVEVVLLMFATDTFKTSTVISKAFSKGFLIDATGDAGTPLSITYDYNDSWGPTDVTWATIVDSQTDLVPLLTKSGD